MNVAARRTGIDHGLTFERSEKGNNGFTFERSEKGNNGFTLIEILMVISIMLIIAGILLPSFGNYLDRQNMIQSIEKVKSDIRTVQNKALAGSAADNLVKSDTPNPETPDYWIIQFYPDNTSNNIYRSMISYLNTLAVCDITSPIKPGDTPNKYAMEFDNFKLGKDFTYHVERSDDNSPACVFISMKTGDVATQNIVKSGSNVVISVKSTELSKCGKISINPFGLVQNTDIEQSCPSPF